MHCVPSPPSPAWCPGGQIPARLDTIKAFACMARGRGAVRTSRGAGMRTGEGGSAPPEAQGPRPRPAAAAAITRPRGGGGVPRAPARRTTVRTLPAPAAAPAATAPRYSRFVHQLPHFPHVQHRAPRGPARCRLPPYPTDPGTPPRRGWSRPGSLPPPTAANSSSLELLLPATATAPPVTRRDAAAPALRGAEVAGFPPAPRAARREL